MNPNIALSFKDEYNKSIRPFMVKVQSLFARDVWSGRPIATHPLASDVDIDKLLVVLRRISQLIGDQLHIDSSNIKKHPEIQKVLDNHSRGSAYIHSAIFLAALGRRLRLRGLPERYVLSDHSARRGL